MFSLHTHAKCKSPACHALELGVLEISIAAGTGADVMVGAASAAGELPESTRRDASPTFCDAARCSISIGHDASLP